MQMQMDEGVGAGIWMMQIRLAAQGRSREIQCNAQNLRVLSYNEKHAY